tara:strand:- start:456 stop:1109 length:654 start_codon:yes stop_codon:yes gene_type:complete
MFKPGEFEKKITITHEALESFKNYWPEHGISDSIYDIAIIMNTNMEEVIHYELFDIDNKNVTVHGRSNQLAHSDEPNEALAALFHDAMHHHETVHTTGWTAPDRFYQFAYRYVSGFDGNGYTVGHEVKVKPGTDLWNRGGRHGKVVGFEVSPRVVRVKLEDVGDAFFYYFKGPAKTFAKLTTKEGWHVASQRSGLIDEAKLDQLLAGEGREVRDGTW